MSGVYVTFVAVDSATSAVLTAVNVTVRDAVSAAMVAQDDFDLSAPGVTPVYTVIPAGTYLLTARADGYTAPFLFPVTVLPAEPGGTGSAVDNLLVIEIPVTTSAPVSDRFPCRVRGRVSSSGPGTWGLGRATGMGRTYDPNTSRYPQTLSRSAHFELLTASQGSETALRVHSRVVVDVDRHGMLEAELEPHSRYRVVLPNISGALYIQTPGPGEDAELSTLVIADSGRYLAELHS